MRKGVMMKYCSCCCKPIWRKEDDECLCHRCRRFTDLAYALGDYLSNNSWRL